MPWLLRVLLIGLIVVEVLPLEAQASSFTDASFQTEIAKIIAAGVQNQTIEIDPRRQDIPLFASRILRDFDYFDRTEYSDPDFSRRPLYLLSALELLGIKAIRGKENIFAFFNSLISLLKTVGFRHLGNFSLKTFGLLNMEGLLSRTLEFQTSVKENQFEIAFLTNCTKPCEVSVGKIPVVPKLVSINAIRLEQKVTAIFHRGTPAIKQGIMASLQSSRLLGNSMKNKKSDLMSEEFISDRGWQTFLPRPLYLQLSGFNVKGQVLRMPLASGIPQAVFVIPRFVSDYRDTTILSQLVAHVFGFSGQILAWDND
jgi:hypothetical protein